MKKFCITKEFDPKFDKSFLIQRLKAAKNIEFVCFGYEGINLRAKLWISHEKQHYLYIVEVRLPSFKDINDKIFEWNDIPQDYIKFNYRGMKQKI